MTQHDQVSSPQVPSLSEPNLGDLLRDIWSGRWFVMAGIFICMIAGYWFVSSTPAYYRATMVIGPVTSPLDTVSSQGRETNGQLILSPARFLHQRNEHQTQDNFIKIETLLTGRAVAQAVHNNSEITTLIRQDRFTYGPEDKTTPISVEKIDDYLNKAIKIRKIGDNAMREIIYHHPNPTQAGRLITEIFHIATNYVRSQDRNQMTQRRAHLIESLRTAHNPDQKTAIAFLLSLEEQRLTLSADELPYAAQIIDPPSLSPRPVWPKLPIFLACGFLFGGFLGYTLFAIIRAIRP